MDNHKILSANLFPVVGIGASAGGLDAFKKLIRAIPERSGMAYILVQHLDPKHESVLPDLLQRVTPIPVHEISDNIHVEPDHIYIIPANKVVEATDGVLQLSSRPPKKRSMPIDIFFASLAEVHQAHAIGIVLSGTQTDGTLGLRAIKERGGATFAQDGSSEFNGMPANAIAAGVVDFILPPEEMPQKLAQLAAQENGTAPKNGTEADEDAYRKIISLLRTRRGNDFTYYKQSTVRRRILRRMVVTKTAEPWDYLEYLKNNTPELDVLYQELLIPVTSFFRDPVVFEKLCKEVFPKILSGKTADVPIRLWVAGCSTGQEVYSMAMCLNEYLGDKFNLENVKIFASDISEPAIAKARAGIYKKSELQDLSARRLQDNFVRNGNVYTINKAIREACVFAVHNFLADPPFPKMDLISCRNVLIYMEPHLQKRALTTFHYALNTDGMLLLGRTETTSSVPELFTVNNKTEKLFSRKDVPGRFLTNPSLQHTKINAANPPIHKIEAGSLDFQKLSDDFLLSRYAPPGVIVDEAMDIVYFRGDTSPYLVPAPGKPSHNLMKMARTDLAFELRNLVHKAAKDGAIASKENIPLQVADIRHYVTLEAIPLPHATEVHYLLLFHNDGKGQNTNGKSAKTRSFKTGASGRDLLIKELEDELALAREDMRSITEEQEAVNEELQSINEELLSGSEELESLNEELQTSKEEMQSANEELMIVNEEMISLNEQVTAARSYAETIVTTIHEPLLVLDTGLRIKTANEAFYNTFGVNEGETEGALFFEVGNGHWNVAGLGAQLESIQQTETKCSHLEIDTDFKNLGRRTMLLNVCEMQSQNGLEKYILLAIKDITQQKEAARKMEESNSRYHTTLMQSPFAFSVMKGKDMEITMANNLMKQFWGKGKDVEGKTLLQVLPELKDQLFPGMIDSVYTTGQPVNANEMPARIIRNGKPEYRYFNIVYQPLLEADETVSGVITIAHEVTDQVLARKKMQQQAEMVNELIRTAPGFVCILSGPDHVYELVNERYQQLFGKRALQGRPILEALPELKGQGFDTLLDTVYNTGETYVGIDIPIMLSGDDNAAPELHYFNFSYQPMYDEDRKVYSILVFGYEVTEQVLAQNKNIQDEQLRTKELAEEVERRTGAFIRTNATLQEKNKMLEKVNGELEAFTYISSHDLQEPLRKIQTFAGRILEKEYASLSDTGKDYFNRMDAAARRMQILIEDLLAYSHTSLNERKSETISLDKIVEEVKADLDELLLEKAAVIDAGKLGEARVNAFQLRQVVHNLVGNALKFSRPGIPPHLIIRSETKKGGQLQNEKLTADKAYLHISFSDNGIGFDPEYKDKIFEVFQRLHGIEDFAGTGIGLSIVKKIVENHNGSITATAESGKGATFDIYLPVE